MSDSWAPSQDLETLSASVFCDELDEKDFADLEASLSDELACLWYRDFYLLQAELCLLAKADRADAAAQERIRQESQLGRSPTMIEPCVSDDSFPVASCSASPMFSFPSTTLHGTLGFFSSGWPVAYLVATVIFGIGLLIGSLVPASRPQQITRQSSPPSRSVGEPKMAPVGRITDMVDCRWSDPNAAVVNGTPISLGHKYALASGLLEITYDSGAKVILQGPVTYEVESVAGGYLSIGKLTARVETAKPQMANPRFAVRTPTVTVTDLGTEFGMEVDKQGLVQVHVFQGVVDARIAAPHGQPERHERVSEGQAIKIGQKDKAFTTVPFAPKSFARKLRGAPASDSAEAAYIQAVLADRPMGYWPLNEPVGARMFRDRSGNGVHGYAMHEVSAGQPGPLTGNSHAIELNGGGYIDLGCHPEFAMKNDFTLEAWVLIGKVKRHSIILSIHQEDRKDHAYPNGWGLGAGRRIADDGSEKPLALFLDSYEIKRFDFPLPDSEVIKDRWLHVAAVCDRANTSRLYLNGDNHGSVAGGRPVDLGNVWLAIGCAESTGLSADQADANRWRGRLAHVAVYPYALTAQQINNHYGLRNDGGKEAVDKHP